MFKRLQFSLKPHSGVNILHGLAFTEPVLKRFFHVSWQFCRGTLAKSQTFIDRQKTEVWQLQDTRSKNCKQSLEYVLQRRRRIRPVRLTNSAQTVHAMFRPAKYNNALVSWNKNKRGMLKPRDICFCQKCNRGLSSKTAPHLPEKLPMERGSCIIYTLGAIIENPQPPRHNNTGRTSETIWNSSCGAKKSLKC